MSNRVVDTHRLTIRELTVDDAPFVLRLTNEASILSNIGDKGIRNLDDAKRFLGEGPWTNQNKSGCGQFLVELKGNRIAAGVCGLLYRENLDVIDIGFAFFPEHRGRGYAFEAARALMEYGRSTLGIDTFVGLTRKDNTPSIKVLEELGMRFRKVVKMSDNDPGTILYS